MRAQTKLTMAVGAGTIVIELGLLAIVGLICLEGTKLVLALKSAGLAEISTTLAALGTGLVLLFLVHNKVSDYLRTKMCWALVRHFHGKE